MTRPDSLAQHLRALSARRPGLFLAGLFAAFLLLLAVLTLLASGVRTEAAAPAIELTRVEGFNLVADTNYVPYLLHSGLTFALLLILIGVYRLTQTGYIRNWAGAMSFLFVLYLYLLGRVYLLSPAPEAEHVDLPAWDVYITDALSFGSTLLALFAAFQILGVELSRRHRRACGVLLFLAVFLLQRLYAGAAFLPFGHKGLLPGGALAMLALFLVGFGLYSRLSDRRGPRRLGAVFPLVIFLLYGAIQPGILLIHQAPYALLATTAAYILKALCTGVLVVFVLNETWQAKEREMGEADQARDESERARQEAERAGEELNRILNENDLGYFRTDRSGLILQANRAEALLLGYDSPEELKNQVNRLALLEDQERRRIIEFQLERAGQVRDVRNTLRNRRQEVRHFLTNLRALPAGDDGELPGYEGIDRDITGEVLLDQEKQRENALRDGFNEAFSSSARVADFFSAILEVGARQSSAGRGALLLVGEETEIPAKLLVVEATWAGAESREGHVFTVPPEVRLEEVGATASSRFLDGLSAALLGDEQPGELAYKIPMQDLDGDIRGVVLLRGPQVDPAELAQRADALGRFLTRVTVGYPLVHRAELQRIKREIRNFLSAGELEAQMQEVVAWLRTELHTDDVTLALRLWKEGQMKFFPRREVGAAQPGSLIVLNGSLPKTPRQAWRPAADGRGATSEVVVPILNQLREPFGYLFVCDRRSPGTNCVTGLSTVDLEKLQEISEAIGLVAEMWVSVKNRTKLLETTTHEFRSPAVAIRNTADTLLKNWNNFEPERIQRKLNDILIDSSLLIRLTNNLDNLSGRPIGLKPREVLLFRDIVFKTVRQLRPLTEHLAFEHDGSHRLPPLWLVEEEISQIFFNLIYNAIKYTDRQGLVRLKVVGGEDGAHYTVKVQDWGIGVPEGFEDKIFEREVRAPNALRSNVLGMGMGLAVSLDLARKMGGDLRLTQHHSPTEFTLFLNKKSTTSPGSPPGGEATR